MCACERYLYIKSKILDCYGVAKWYSKKPPQTPGFSRGGALDFGFTKTPGKLKIHGIVRALVL